MTRRAPAPAEGPGRKIHRLYGQWA